MAACAATSRTLSRVTARDRLPLGTETEVRLKQADVASRSVLFELA